MQVRAYDVPPFRAEEFLFADGPADVSAIVGNGPEIPIRIGGGLTVPSGYVACLRVARQIVGTYINLGYAAAPVQWATAFTWTLSVNGTPVPGYLNRPSSWGVGNVTGELYIGPQPSFYSTTTMQQATDLVVPIKLYAGDALSYHFTNNTGALGVLVGVTFQGYLFPVSNAQGSARGWLADEIEA